MTREEINMLSRLCFVTVLLLATNPAYGQLGTGAISGTILDQTGAVLPGANVTVTNTGTGFMRETVSSDAGDYRLSGLLPGTYELVVELAGFSRFVRSNLTLQVDQNARIDVRLQVGNSTENVIVTEQAPLLQSEQSSVGAVVDRQKIVDLPLNGRNFVQLATLMPGVNTGDGGTPGGGISIAGARPEQNSFLLDGTINSDQFNNLLNFRPSIDILQEFKIQTSNYSAEFGKGAGGQINLVTKSGTNEFHGTAYEFNRNNAVQARNLFDLNPAFQNKSGKIIAPPFNQNQFGVTIGGPVTLPKYKGKNKTFFFGGYEGFRLRRGNTTLTTVPTQEQRRGDFSRNLTTQSLGTDALGRPIFRGAIYDPRTTRTVDGRIVRDPFPGNIITTDQFDPVAAKALALPGFYPLPNTAGSFGSDGNPRLNYFDGRTRSNDFDQFNLRIDQMVTAKDTIFGRYSFNDSDEFNPRTFPGYGESSAIRNQAFTFSDTHILGPTTLNEFRFGYLRYAEFTAAENTVAGRDIVKELGIRGFPFAGSPSLRGAPQFTISGFAGPGDNEGGRPLRLKNNTFQFIDHFSFNTGRHYLKVGGEIRRIRLDSIRAQTVRGQFTFDSANWTGLSGFTATGNSLANFLLGLPRQKGRRVGDFAHNLRATEYATFIQDDWKVSPKLTLNIGLRYMLYVPPKDTRDRISTVVYPKGRPGSYAEGATQFLTLEGLQKAPSWGRAGIELPRSIFPIDKKDFGPRFGFAFRPVEKIVIRGGYGIFFDTVQGVITEDVIENIPNVKEDQQTLSIYQDVSRPPAEAFIGYLIESPGPGQFNPGPNDVDPNFRNSYMQNWNFGIQREFGRNLLIEIEYVGSKGTRLNRRENTNTAEPNGPGALIQLSSIPAQPINPLTGQPFLSDPIANAGLRERFRRLVPIAINQWENNTLYFLDNVFQTTSTAFSNYHSLQMRGEKRLSGGLTFLAAWTWSKGISDATGFSGGGAFDTGNRIQDIFNKKADKGLSSLDHRHRFSYAFVYELPFGANKPFLSGASSVLQKIVGGWVVDGIYTLQSGLPLTVKFNGDVFSSGTDNARPDLVCNPQLPRDKQTLDRFFKTECFQRQSPIRFGTAGRATVIGPGINNFDIALMKNTRIGEKVNTQFRTEFFNAFNHPQLNPPNRFIDQAGFGVISSARDPRIIQFGLKLIF
jgi:Carboxypeptidase regulatory-like domain/TonB-dependent Receptor Plug Domain